MKELIAYAKANPGKLTNASSSNGSPGHVGGELFKFMTGTQIVHVPYRGGAAATNDLIAGRVDLMFESLNSISSHVEVRLGARAGGDSGDKRSVAFPDIPTVAEAGVPGYSAPTWSGVIGPAGMPRPIVDKINAAINRALQTEAFKTRFAAIGDEPAGGTPEEFAATIAKDSAQWKSVVERARRQARLGAFFSFREPFLHRKAERHPCSNSTPKTSKSKRPSPSLSRRATPNCSTPIPMP